MENIKTAFGLMVIGFWMGLGIESSKWWIKTTKKAFTEARQTAESKIEEHKKQKYADLDWE